MSDCWPLLAQLVEATAYRSETRSLPLANGHFPGIALERTFIKHHLVDGIAFVEFQRATGTRHVMDIEIIERVTPLGRAILRPDTLRSTEATNV